MIFIVGGKSIMLRTTTLVSLHLWPDPGSPTSIPGHHKGPEGRTAHLVFWPGLQSQVASAQGPCRRDCIILSTVLTQRVAGYQDQESLCLGSGGLPGGAVGKNAPAKQETRVQSPIQEDPTCLRATHEPQSSLGSGAQESQLKPYP